MKAVASLATELYGVIPFRVAASPNHPPAEQPVLAEHLEMSNLRTANDRFKNRRGRYNWAAAALAVVIHVIVLFWFPSFEVRGSSSRMVVWVGPWHPPAAAGEHDFAGFVPLDTVGPRPVLINRSQVNQRLPGVYPWALWHHKEPSSALVEVAVSRSGRVRYAKLLESSENGGDAALLEVIRQMRFDLSDVAGNARGIVAAVDLTIAER